MASEHRKKLENNKEWVFQQLKSCFVEREVFSNFIPPWRQLKAPDEKSHKNGSIKSSTRQNHTLCLHPSAFLYDYFSIKIASLCENEPGKPCI